MMCFVTAVVVEAGILIDSGDEVWDAGQEKTHCFGHRRTIGVVHWHR